MGFFDKLFGWKKKNQKEEYTNSSVEQKKRYAGDNGVYRENTRGLVTGTKTEVNHDVLKALKQRYIAFDVETTGLYPSSDRIVEIGAVLFENGKPSKKYGTLVNAMVSIPSSATAVNHIDNNMIKTAPSETEVYRNLVDFLGDSLQKNTIICAHNAKFDFGFLSETLMRLGYDGNIRYVDTLSLSRKWVKGLVNYKQETVANYFGLYNTNAHRAENDAEICGNLLWKLLQIINLEYEKSSRMLENSKPNEEEKEVCAVIHNIITDRKGDTDLLGFYKNSSGYIDVCYLYTILKFKFAKKRKYIIVKSNIKGLENYRKEPCTISEGGSDFVRIFFDSPLDLELLSDFIFEEYKTTHKFAFESLEYDKSYLYDYKNGPIMNNALSTNEVESILNIVRSKEYIRSEVLHSEELIDRDSIEIQPINDRVPFSKIKNLKNSRKGFDDGFSYWEEGEEYRKSGDFYKAIELYDKARASGYTSPALYNSYSMAYHKLKDYDNEIDILDEGIEREGAEFRNISKLLTRRNTAIKTLLKKREKEQHKREKRIENNPNPIVNKSSQKKTRRPILQMDDNLNLIQRFESIADATKTTSINSKSIRDAAKGVQKHAGGFVWRYADEHDLELD